MEDNSSGFIYFISVKCDLRAVNENPISKNQ